MLELKTLQKDAIPAALKMAERYRLLNDPISAESICLDILNTEPDNQAAMIVMLLALTDRFDKQLTPAFSKAMEILERLSDQYCKDYYGGVIFERRAKAHLASNQPGSGEIAYQWFEKALAAFDRALTVCMPGNQDAALRWNSCARMINDNPHVKPGDTPRGEELLDSYD
jgi:hypothetical protein